MKFESIYHNIFKIKYLLKFTQIFFFFNSARLKSKNWVLVEQTLKILKLDYYKVYNIIANKLILFSIFKKNVRLIINGTFTFIKLSSKTFSIIPKIIINNNIYIHSLLIFLSIKINNKIYSFLQIKKINFLNFNKNFLIFNYLLKKKIKKQLIILNFN